MREILFRGKSNWTYGNVKEGDWLYGMTISRHCYNDEEITSYYIGGGNNTIDGKTLGQYTGLTDKNGKKIFEGDIVRIHERTMNRYDIGIIQYNAPKFVMLVYRKETGWRYFHDIVESDTMQDMQAVIPLKYEYEVIGNIHDNPELL